nr:hypothetical protein [Flavobacterium covae]
MFEIVSNGISFLFGQIGVSKEITDGLPVALLRPFSSGGSRGFMIDAMRTSRCGLFYRSFGLHFSM